MSDLKGEASNGIYAKFLCDVIKRTTPEWAPFDGNPASNWYDQMWGRGNLVHPYCDFVGSLFGLSLQGSARTAHTARSVHSYGHAQAQYAVMTFNYDRVLENLCENASEFFGKSDAVGFRSATEKTLVPFDLKPILVKLHGDVASDSVVPPTWSKGIDEVSLPLWRQAYQVLKEATCIRILGYSLPAGDSYFRFLLKAALADGRHTKEIDVVCLDPSGYVRTQYQDFLIYRKLRFFDVDVLDYLEMIRSYPGPEVRSRTPQNELQAGLTKPYGWLEDAHARFVKNHAP